MSFSGSFGEALRWHCVSFRISNPCLSQSWLCSKSFCLRNSDSGAIKSRFWVTFVGSVSLSDLT